MEPLLERLGRGEIVVGDGAWGTLLIERGLRPGQCPEALTLEAPEILEEIARLYLEAGAEIITTNTFGGSPVKLRSYDLENDTEEINRRAAGIVRDAVGDRAYVSGSVGPSGAILKPYGDTDADELYGSFERQTRALATAGVDLFCVETMIDLGEATLAVRAAKAVAPDIPVIATMTFGGTPRGFFTVMGVTIEQAVAGLEDAGADVIGSNCGNGIEAMVEIARAFKEHGHCPIVIQSNAGVPKSRGGRVVYPETPEFMAERAAELVELGVAVIGGCCGTTPEHVRAIRERVDSGTARD